MTKHPEAQELKCMTLNSTVEDQLLARNDKTSKVTERTVQLGNIAKINVIIVTTNLPESEITTHTGMFNCFFMFITEKKFTSITDHLQPSVNIQEIDSPNQKQVHTK